MLQGRDRGSWSAGLLIRPSCIGVNEFIDVVIKSIGCLPILPVFTSKIKTLERMAIILCVQSRNLRIVSVDRHSSDTKPQSAR